MNDTPRNLRRVQFWFWLAVTAAFVVVLIADLVTAIVLGVSDPAASTRASGALSAVGAISVLGGLAAGFAASEFARSSR